MEEYFEATEYGIKTLSFPKIDNRLFISVTGCFSIVIKTAIKPDKRKFSVVYNQKEYKCSKKIFKYFVKKPVTRRHFTVDFKFNSENNENLASDIKIESPNEEIKSENESSESNAKIESDAKITDSDNEPCDDKNEDNIPQSDEEFFVKTLIGEFFNGMPIFINADNYQILEFISKPENLDIPAFQKICSIFDKFYQYYDIMDPISEIQEDIINIQDLVGIDESQSEILQSDSFDFLNMDFDADSIDSISSFGSLCSFDNISPSVSISLHMKAKDAIDELVDRIADNPELSKNTILLYHILMNAAIYRPENIKFYISMIKELNDPPPQGKGIKIIDVIRELYLHKINDTTDFFVIHEMMVGEIFTRKEVLDVVKESTNLDFKIWFAPYIEEEEEKRKMRHQNHIEGKDGSTPGKSDSNDKDSIDKSDSNDDDEGYGNIIQDIEDRIYSIPDQDKRAFKAHFFESIRKNNWSYHRQLAREGANHTPIARAIRKDDPKRLQQILTFDSNASVDDTIKWSAFDHIQFIKNSPTLIQYAAFYGSIKCFKYLLLNHANLRKVDLNKNCLFNFAVAGGNAEIVRICMQKNLYNLSVLSPACLFYRYDMMDYIVENIFPTFIRDKFRPLKNALLSSIDSFNFAGILKFFPAIDIEALFKSAGCQNEPILNILSLFKFSNKDKVNMLLWSTESHNFNFFKQIFSTLNIKKKEIPLNSTNFQNNIEGFIINHDRDYSNDSDYDENDGVHIDLDDLNYHDPNVEAAFAEIINAFIAGQGNNANDANNPNAPNNRNQNNNNNNNEHNNDNENNNNNEHNNDNENNNNNEHNDDYDEEEEYEPSEDEDVIVNNVGGHNNDDEGFTLSDTSLFTLMIQATCNDSPELLEFINDKICQIEPFRSIPAGGLNVNYDIISLSISYGSIRCLKYIMSLPNFNIENCNKDGYSILRLAILNNQAEVLKFLLSLGGLNVNNTEKDGGSALTAAAWDNQIPLVKILYEHGGIDINMKGKLGETPLTGTVIQKIPKMMELLLSYPETNVYEPNKDNTTAMMLCLDNNEIDCFFTLIKSPKFDINSTKSCFNCSTALYAYKSETISPGMLEIVINAPGINLEEMYEGNSLKTLLKIKILGQSKS